jgi:hypothetical protein
MKARRTCAVCGKDQYRKKVWSKYKGKVICMTCGREWAFWADGTVYSMKAGPSQEQKRTGWPMRLRPPQEGEE